jgi:hypothetical protein
MEIDAYSLVLIAGGFTLLGALISVISAYWLSIHLERIKERRTACAKLRAAFAPALSILYIARSHGAHDKPPVDTKIKLWLLDHGAAVEEFRPFVPASERSAYQAAWEGYRQTAAQSESDTTGKEWGLKLKEGELLEKNIYAVLRFTET